MSTTPGRGVARAALLFGGALLLGACDQGLGPVVEGDVKIEDATSLADYASVTEITGDLWIDGIDSPDLQGLDALTTVGGALVIGVEQGNPALTSLEGLQNLGDVGRHLSVENNPVLESLAGLRGLSIVQTSASIKANPQLVDLGLSGLSYVGDTLDIADNASLATLSGLAGLREVVDLLRVAQNPVLTSIAGLSGLETVGRLAIEDNAALPTCQAEALLAGLRAKGQLDEVASVAVVRGNDDQGTCEEPG